MALTFFFVPAGTLAAFALIRYYDDHSGRLNRRDICTGLLWCALWLLLSIFSRTPLSLPLSLSMGLLCACTVTDSLRTWLPAELTLPLAVSMLWHASLFPWGFQNALIWGRSGPHFTVVAGCFTGCNVGRTVQAAATLFWRVSPALPAARHPRF